jgi:hypothetical protein
MGHSPTLTSGVPTGQHKTHAAGQAITIDFCYNRLGVACDSFQQIRIITKPILVFSARRTTEVCSGTKGFVTGAGDQDYPDIGVFFSFIEILKE